MLAFFALLLFGLLSVAALVVDLGLVSLSRVQMQQAADAAALEGLRQRNPVDFDGITGLTGFDDWFRSDCVRRSSAARLVAWTYDDDFDLSGDALQLGAGPDLAIVGGVGELDARGTIERAGGRAYKPRLERNQEENLVFGDMVSGEFLGSDEPSVRQPADYTRDDFAPLSAIPPGASGLDACPPGDDFSGVPSSGEGPLRDPAFLVRLRRTNDFGGLDEVPGVSSRGAPVPLLFGRGTTIQAVDPAAGYSVRHHGVTVRATAIAEERPALEIGTAGFPAAVPLVIERAFWQDPCWDGTITDVFVDELTGGVTDVGVCAGAVVGRVVSTPLFRVGEPVPFEPPMLLDTAFEGYAAIVDQRPGWPAPRVVGFGWVSFDEGVLEKQPGKIAPVNASAHLVSGWPEGLTDEQRREVLAISGGLNDAGVPARQKPLLAPVLVR